MFEIWHDNDFDLAHWLYLNSALSDQEVVLRQIPKTNSPSDLLKHFKNDSDLSILPSIKYETPDIILIRNDGKSKPKIELVIEFMTHTPQHDHPLQRFTRIYGSAWLGIPSVLIIPEKKEKLEKGQKDSYKPTIYRANPLIYHLFLKTSAITKTPTLLLMWPEQDGYLKYDKRHPTAPKIEKNIALLIELVNGIVENRSTSSLVESHTSKQASAQKYNPNGNNYDLTSGEVMKTAKLLSRFEKYLKGEVVNRLNERVESFVYTPKGLKDASSSFRTDPYAGKVCAFDILFCRDLAGVRTRNLVLQANKVPSKSKNSPTLINEAHDETNCPFISPSSLASAKRHFEGYCPYSEKKQQRIYGEVPDLIIFEDGGTYVPRR
jgi:hypothetical protein